MLAIWATPWPYLMLSLMGMGVYAFLYYRRHLEEKNAYALMIDGKNAKMTRPSAVKHGFYEIGDGAYLARKQASIRLHTKWGVNTLYIFHKNNPEPISVDALASVLPEDTAIAVREALNDHVAGDFAREHAKSGKEKMQPLLLFGGAVVCIALGWAIGSGIGADISKFSGGA